jgi:hypothetical protein
MSDTPRTDALLVALGAAGSKSRIAEHARTLERELAMQQPTTSDTPRTDAKTRVIRHWSEAMKWYGEMVQHARQLERELNAKQAEVDRLMLEYCPQEMTAEQMQTWASHQRPAQDDVPNVS